jgi:nucleoside-diphosphate-sugar epimerase
MVFDTMTDRPAKRIGVVGAGGFVGTAFVERSLSRNENNVVPIIHSSGNAWRLTRWGLPVVTATLLDKDNLARALAGCTHVVNCSRGSDEVMLAGLENLLDVCAGLKVRGFVHLSSVLVYGDPPPSASTGEGADARPEPGTYGAIKLAQDNLVQRAAASGLPSTILCPPNIGGPYSSFLLGLLDAVRTDRFALLDSGDAVVNLVDVQNLCHAMELALELGSARPRRLFITDDAQTVWRDLVAPLAHLAERKSDLRTISVAALERLRDAERQQPPRSIGRSLKHLVSSDVREALRKDPLLARGELWIRRRIAGLGSRTESALRLSIEGPRQVPRIAQEKPLAVGLCAQQLRGVRHSCAAAKEVLGYEPEVSFADSMHAFERWYRSHLGMNTAEWPLLQYISRLA